MQSGIVKAHCIRLLPNDDLVPSLQKAAQQAMENSNSSSAFIMTAVGSLTEVKLRLANACRGQPNEIKEWKERFEIVSLVGTFSKDSKHLHMSVSDKDGNTYGGHVMSGKIFTTLELVLGTVEGVAFEREVDVEGTGFDELVVKPMPK
mmetsp:Transcript_32978/g.46832  ORF Transcript_32978/g.46832 Transcript_32978/m.46832 type:complete len:148 (-) Transcript_32978:305-748(-)